MATPEQVVYQLRIDTSSAKPQFDAIKRETQALGNVSAKIEFKGLNDLKAELRQLETVRDNALDFKTASAAVGEIKKIEREIEKLNADLNKSSGGGFLSGITDKLKGGGSQIADIALGGILSGGVTAAADLAVQGFQKVIEVGSQFQSSMADLSAITGITGAPLKALGNDIRELNLEFGGGTQAQAESYKGILSRLGPEIADVPAALKEIATDVNILSKATGDDAVASMDALTTAALQFGTDLSDPAAAAEDITKKMNTIAASAKVGAAEVPQVADAMKQAGVALKGANVSFEESAAAIQVLAAGGKTGSEGGVGIRNIIGLLQKQSSEGEAILKSFGTSTKDLGAILTEQGLGAALEKLQGGLNTLGSDAERNKAKITLFGQDSSAAAGILLDNTSKLKTFTDGVTGTNTAFEQAAIRQDTFGEKMAKVGAFLEDVGISIFQGVGDAVSFVIDNFQAIASVYSIFILGPIGPGVVALIANFTAVKDAITNVASDIGNFLGIVSDVDNANTHAGAAVRSAASAYDEYTKSIGEANTAVGATDLVGQQVADLEKLQSKTELTADEQQRLAKETASLAAEFPEATAGVNDLTGEYDVNLQKLKELNGEQAKLAGDERKKLIEENLLQPTKDMLPALDAQKEKLGELRQALDEAIATGDKDAILETRDAYNQQRDAVKGTSDQMKKNIEQLIATKTIEFDTVESTIKKIQDQTKVSREEAAKQVDINAVRAKNEANIAKALGITAEEAKKIAPQVQKAAEDQAKLKAETDAVAQSAAGMAAAFGEAAAAAKAQFDEQLGALNDIDLKILENNRKRKGASAEDRKLIDEDNAKLRKDRADQIKLTAEADKKNDEVSAISTANAATFANDKKTKQQESFFEKERKRLEEEAKARTNIITANENKLTAEAIAAFQDGTRKQATLYSSDQAGLTQSRIDSLNKQKSDIIAKLAETDADGNVIALKVGVAKKGEEAKTFQQLVSIINDLNAKLNTEKKNLIAVLPNIDKNALSKIDRDLQSGLDTIFNKEIEVGIRPKEDALDLINKQLERLQTELDASRLELKLDITGNPIGVLSEDFKKLTKEEQDAQVALLKAINDANIKKLDLQKNAVATTLGLEKQLRDARIANIEDNLARERAALLAKQADELEFIRQREASGNPLNERELDLKKQLEKKHLSEMLTLYKKYEEEKFATTRQFANDAKDFAVGTLNKLLDNTNQLSEAETASKKLEFDKQQRALEKSLGKGEISHEEYNISLAKLSEERTEFENQQSGAFVQIVEDSLKQALEKAGDYFSTLAFSYFIDQSLAAASEITKSTEVQAGTATRIAAMEAEIAILREKIALQTGDAATAVAASAAISIPPPFNILAAIAAATAVSVGISALVRGIKFEHGGIGLVGERGPEFIGPTKDFSQFASQLVLQAVQATKQALSIKQGGFINANGGGGQAVNVNLTGKSTLHGRKIDTVLQKEKFSRSKEIVRVN